MKSILGADIKMIIKYRRLLKNVNKKHSAVKICPCRTNLVVRRIGVPMPANTH